MLKSRKVSFLAYALLLLAIGATLLWPQKAAATTGIPFQISFEGKIVKSDGTNITDGTYNMEFKIYSGTSNTGVGDTLLFTEDWLVGSSQGGVAFTSGTYAKNIGSAGVGTGDSVALSSLNFNQYPLWLSVQIGNTSSCTITTTFQSNCGGDGEMTPYIQFTSAPYALNSNEVGGLTASQLGQLAANQTWTGTNTFQPTVSTGALQVDNASNPVFTVDTSGNNVIIGKAGAQTATLELANATGTNVVGLQAGASTAAYTLTLPTTAPLTNQCLISGATTATNLVFGSCSSGTYLAKNALDSSSANVSSGNYLYAFTNSSSGVTSSVLSLNNGSNTNDTLFVTASGNPAAGQALIVANETNGAPSGNLIDLQVSGTSKFKADAAGNITAVGTTGLTLSGASAGITFSGGGTNVISSTGSNASLTVKANGTGTLTLDTSTAGSGVVAIGVNAATTNIGGGASNEAINIGNSTANDTVSINNTTSGTNSLQIGNATHGSTVTIYTSSTGTTIKSPSNTATAFQVQNANSNNILNVDTTINRVTVGGTLNLNQIAEPLSPPSLADAGAGSLSAGTYCYIYTYVTPSGETPANDGTNPCITVAASHNVTVSSISVSPSAYVTARKVYRGSSSGGPFSLDTTISNNTATSFTDSNTSLGASYNNLNTTAALYVGGGLQYTSDSATGNLLLGVGALGNGTNGYGNTAVGNAVLQNATTDSENTGLGSQALQNDSGGDGNTGLGFFALQANTSGTNNSGSGDRSLQANTTGSQNTGSGTNSLGQTTTGSNNTGVGYHALYSNTTGSYNSALGYRAGEYDSGGNFYSGAALQNATAIGAYTQVQSNNTIVLGSVDTATATVVGATEGSVNGSGVATGNPLQVDPLAYNTGTACSTASSGSSTCAAGAFLFGSGTTWTSSMVGDQIIFADGTTANITAYTSATALSLDRSITETSTSSYRIHQIGLQVTSAGHVGVGATSPGNTLTVNIGSNGTPNDGILIQGSTSSVGDLGVQIQNTGTGGADWFIDSTNNGSGYGGGKLALVSGIGSTPTMTLQNGYVSIGGTSTGTYTLNVQGTANFTNYLYGNGNQVFQTTDSWLRLNPAGNFSSGIYAGTGILRTDGSLEVGNAGGNFLANTTGVGINGGSPSATYRLNVNGGAQISGQLNMPTGQSLGTTAGNRFEYFNMGGSVSNNLQLSLWAVRNTNGTDWTTTGLVLQRTTDVTNQAYLSFWNSSSVCINTVSCTHNFGVSGTIAASSTITASTTPDISETIPTSSDVVPEDVVSAGPDGNVDAVKSSTPYDPTTIGVISDGSSSFKINSNAGSESAAPTGQYLVLAGRVPVHVTNEGGPIEPGDYLTTSSTPGYAMKATHAGPTIGKALAAFNGTIGSVMTQTNLSYYDPASGNYLQDGDSALFSDLNVSGVTTLTDLTVTGDAHVQGSLTVDGSSTFNGTITVNGHIVTGGTAPTVQINSNAGQGATVTVDGNDTSGTITITTGEAAQPPKSGNPAVPAPTSGDEAALTFSSPFGSTPRIIITGNDSKSATLQVYPDQQSTTGFSLGINQTPAPNTTYTFNYFVVQ